MCSASLIELASSSGPGQTRPWGSQNFFFQPLHILKYFKRTLYFLVRVCPEETHVNCLNCGWAGRLDLFIKSQYVNLWGVTVITLKYSSLCSGAPRGPLRPPGALNRLKLSPYAGLYLSCAFLPLQWLEIGIFHWLFKNNCLCYRLCVMCFVFFLLLCL